MFLRFSINLREIYFIIYIQKGIDFKMLYLNKLNFAGPIKVKGYL